MRLLRTYYSNIAYLILALVCAIALTGCGEKRPQRFQGYVEGEFVYVASPLAGQVTKLYVRRGDQVKTGDPLFALETTAELAARDEAKRRLDQGEASLEDAKKGQRPSEIESLESQLKQARAASVFSEIEYERQEKLAKTGARSQEDLDRARSTRDQDRNRVAQLESDLITARLGSRVDQIRAAEHNVQALKAALDRAEWNFSQKSQTAPQDALVFDTIYREGDWVAAGRPVVALLPPPNVKVRVFVPERQLGAVRYGQTVRVIVDGLPEPVTGKVSFISPRAEYTPPVIYSQESRSKLVFMIEAVFDAKTAAKLHPGQPVDVEFGQ
jgi:HlyD family secretion protein